MTKKDKNDDSLTECPVCNSSVTKKNLSRHLSKVHPLNKLSENKKEDDAVRINKEIHDIKNELRVHKRRRNIVSVLFVAMVIFLPVTYAITLPPNEISTSKSTNSNQGLVSAPVFSSIDVVTGDEISLSDFKGKIVLLNVVNYGCNQRTNEIVSDQLLAIKSLTEQRDDFIPVSVFCGCCPVETLRNFATENELTWPWILDSDYSIIQGYLEYVREYGYPTLIFINKDQYIVDFGGYYDTSALSAMIDEML